MTPRQPSAKALEAAAKLNHSKEACPHANRLPILACPRCIIAALAFEDLAEEAKREQAQELEENTGVIKALRRHREVAEEANARLMDDGWLREGQHEYQHGPFETDCDDKGALCNRCRWALSIFQRHREKAVKP